MKITPELIVTLAAKLAKLPELSSFNSGNEREADRISNGIVDIVTSAEKLLVIVNNILASSTDSEIEDELVELYEELNHIAYHLADMKSFSVYRRN